MPIPVQRAETYYLAPPQSPADLWAAVPPAELCLRWYELRMQRRIAIPSGILLGQQLYARIDSGRWVADCTCGSAQVITPTDPRFACPECGAGWFTVVFPADASAAEATVADQLPSEQWWWNPADPNPWNQPPVAPVEVSA